MRDERGTSLIEAMVAAAVATVGAMAMMYALGLGNRAVRSAKVERAAIYVGQKKMEALLAKPSTDPDLTVGSHGPETSVLPHGNASTTWTVTWVDDTLDGSGGGDATPNDYKKLEVIVAWTDAIARDTRLSTYLSP